MLTKQLIIKKTIAVANSTMISRLLGLIREALMLNYLVPGIVTDAFITAFKIPNSLRKIFAEGALSAALIPTFVTLVKRDKKKEIDSLMSLSIIIFEGILLLVCCLIFWKAQAVIRFISPGWYCSSSSQEFTFFGISFIDRALASCIAYVSYAGNPMPIVDYTVSFLRILISLILFLSTSALLASALQAVNHFFVPAFAQVVLNIVFIIGLIVCIAYWLPVTYLCYFILFGCFLPFVLHVITYVKLGFRLGVIDTTTWHNFRKVMHKFLPCLLSMSVMELYLFVDTSLGSFLPEGSISLIYYANRFMGIPLGVFAVAFSTILLPHFAHIGVYAPKRLSFYLLESAKLIWWVMVPVSLFLGFVAEKLFSTLSSKFSPAHVHEAGWILIAYVLGLFFFSLNKILLNLYYALHDTTIPLYISVVATILNFCLSYYLLMPLYGAYGIALATTISGIVQTILFLVGLHYYFGFKLYLQRFAYFVGVYSIQLSLGSALFLLLYYGIEGLIHTLPVNIAHFFLVTIGYWFWVMPLTLLLFFILFKTRKRCAIELYFLN